MSHEQDYLAVAVDWLDAYRACDLDAILNLYDTNAVIDCGCGGRKVITGREALRVYWQKRLQDYPASELDDLALRPDGAIIAYRTNGGTVSAVLEFNSFGLIGRSACGPLSGT